MFKAIRKILPLLLCLFLMACLLPAAFADGSSADAFSRLKQAIANQETELDISNYGTVTFDESIDIPAGMRVRAAGTEIVVPADTTLTVSGTLNVMKLTVQEYGSVVVNRGILNLTGGDFTLDGRLRVIGTPVQVGTGTWHNWLDNGTTSRITYEDGGSLTLLRVVYNEEQLADAFAKAPQYKTEHTSFQINVAFEWNVSGEVTVPADVAVFIVNGHSLGSLTVDKGGTLILHGDLRLPPDAGNMTNNGEIRVENYGTIAIGSSVQNDGIMYLKQRPNDMTAARLTLISGAKYAGYGVFRLVDANDPYSCVSGLDLSGYSSVQDTKHSNEIALSPAEVTIFGTDLTSFNWEVHGFKEQCESGVVDHIQLRGLDRFVIEESMNIPKITTVEVFGGTVEIPAGVALNLKGRLILREGAVLNVLQTSSANRGRIIGGTLEVDTGSTVNLMGKLEIDKLRLDGTLTTQNSGAWYEFELTDLDNGRPRGRMIISNGGQHTVSSNGLDEAKLQDWVRFEGDQASLEISYRAKSDQDLTEITQRIRNLPARFQGSVRLRYGAVIRGDYIFPGIQIRVDGSSGGSLKIAEGAVLTAPTIFSKGAEIIINGTFISIPRDNNNHNGALMLQGNTSRLTVSDTGIIGGTDCTIEIGTEITDPEACLDGVKFSRLQNISDPIRAAAGFLTYRFIPELSLPAALNTIESEAFAGGSFSSVYIPAGVTSIAPDAFGDRTDLKVYGEYNTEAATFAAGKGFPFAPSTWS